MIMSIEKFSGQFRNESRGCTVLINETVQAILDFSVLGLYTYLCSKPETWEPNVIEIMRHTGYSKQKTYRLINALLVLRLMTKKAIREKGRFTHFQYTIHLHPQGLSPVPKKQEVEKQEVENEDAYKTKNLQNKEKDIISESIDSQKTTQKNKVNKTYESIKEFIDIWNEVAVPNGNAKQGTEKRSVAAIARNLQAIKEHWEIPLTPKNFKSWLINAINAEFYMFSNPDFLHGMDVCTRWTHFNEAFSKQIKVANE